MSIDRIRIKEMIDFLCYYKDVEIVHTFSKEKQPLLRVSFLANTGHIQIIFVQTKKIEYFDNVDKAVSFIENILNK